MRALLKLFQPSIKYEYDNYFFEVISQDDEFIEYNAFHKVTGLCRDINPQRRTLETWNSYINSGLVTPVT